MKLISDTSLWSKTMNSKPKYIHFSLYGCLENVKSFQRVDQIWKDRYAKLLAFFPFVRHIIVLKQFAKPLHQLEYLKSNDFAKMYAFIKLFKFNFPEALLLNQGWNWIPKLLVKIVLHSTSFPLPNVIIGFLCRLLYPTVIKAVLCHMSVWNCKNLEYSWTTIAD